MHQVLKELHGYLGPNNRDLGRQGQQIANKTAVIGLGMAHD